MLKLDDIYDAYRKPFPTSITFAVSWESNYGR